MTRPYRTAAIGGPGSCDPGLVLALQADLRALGYLARGIDGALGPATRAAIRALQYDLLHNDGQSTAGDGDAPVAVSAYNRGVIVVTGIVDPACSDSIDAMLSDPAIIALPANADPVTANRAVLAAIAGARRTIVPTPFLLAVVMQESSGQHYAQPQSTADQDRTVMVGLDRNGSDGDHVTSRGYGIGQYTLFHHPPRAEEVAQAMLDPLQNVAQMIETMADKFGHEVIGPNGADDRAREHPLLPLRPCRYGPADPRFMTDCRACAIAAGSCDIGPQTALFAGSSQTYGQAHDYATVSHDGVPDRAGFQCDWPYAVRRYNGAGPNSFAYQALILSGLLTLPTG